RPCPPREPDRPLWHLKKRSQNVGDRPNFAESSEQELGRSPFLRRFEMVSYRRANRHSQSPSRRAPSCFPAEQILQGIDIELTLAKPLERRDGRPGAVDRGDTRDAMADRGRADAALVGAGALAAGHVHDQG